MKEPSIRMIADVVCARFGHSWTELSSPRKHADLVYARHLTIWLARAHTSQTLPQIGRRLGGRDHTTILASLRRIQAWIDDGRSDVLAEINLLEAALRHVQSELIRHKVAPPPDADAVAIASRVLTEPRGTFGLSVSETVLLCRTVLAQAGQIERAAAACEPADLDDAIAALPIPLLTRKETT